MMKNMKLRKNINKVVVSMKFISMLLILVLVASTGVCGTKIVFDFNESTQWWEIPEWASENIDYAGVSSGISNDFAFEGENSLKLICDFPGDVWKSAIVEHERDIDLTGYKKITAHVYVPEDVKAQYLEARIVVTAGDWFFIETRDSVKLKTGKWTTVEAVLNVSANGELKEWRCNDRQECIRENLNEVKRLAVRIEQNANPWQPDHKYSGSVYIDDIVIE